MESRIPLPAPRKHGWLPVPVGSVTSLLEAGVPLSLLIDLAEPSGPHSEDLYSAEPGDAGWLQPVSH